MSYRQDVCPKCKVEMIRKVIDIDKPSMWGIVTGMYLGGAVKILKCPKCGYEKHVRCRYEQYSVYDPILLICEDGTEYG